MHLSDLATPQVIVDRQRLLDNLSRGQRLADSSGRRLRPHAKTHKSPEIARWQIDRGAVGICCAKVGEARRFRSSSTISRWHADGPTPCSRPARPSTCS